MPEQLFDGIDVTLPDEQLAEWLQWVLDKRVELAPDDETYIINLSEAEVRMLREWSRTAGPKTREVVIEHLAHHGPCDWSDLEEWALDPATDVRNRLFSEITMFDTLYASGALCFADKERCVALLSSAAEKYPEDSLPSISAMCDLSQKGEEWLGPCWREADRLLDIDDEELNSHLVAAYFEDVVWFLRLGPDDQRVRSWIDGDDSWRLLKIATWVGLDEGRLREIVEALIKVKTKVTYLREGGKEEDVLVADLAKGVLAGTVGYNDV